MMLVTHATHQRITHNAASVVWQPQKTFQYFIMFCIEAFIHCGQLFCGDQLERNHAVSHLGIAVQVPLRCHPVPLSLI